MTLLCSFKLYLVPPSIEASERMLTVTEGGVANLSCTAAGVPVPKISWIHDGRTMLTSGGRYDISDSGTLFIDGVQVRPMSSICVCVGPREI